MFVIYYNKVAGEIGKNHTFYLGSTEGEIILWSEGIERVIEVLGWSKQITNNHSNKHKANK